MGKVKVRGRGGNSIFRASHSGNENSRWWIRFSPAKHFFPPFPVRGTCFAKLMNETWYLHGSPCVYAPAKEEVHQGEGGTSVGGEMGESGSEVNQGTCGSNPQN